MNTNILKQKFKIYIKFGIEFSAIKYHLFKMYSYKHDLILFASWLILIFWLHSFLKQLFWWSCLYCLVYTVKSTTLLQNRYFKYQTQMFGVSFFYGWFNLSQLVLGCFQFILNVFFYLVVNLTMLNKTNVSYNHIFYSISKL